VVPRGPFGGGESMSVGRRMPTPQFVPLVNAYTTVCTVCLFCGARLFLRLDALLFDHSLAGPNQLTRPARPNFFVWNVNVCIPTVCIASRWEESRDMTEVRMCSTAVPHSWAVHRGPGSNAGDRFAFGRAPPGSDGGPPGDFFPLLPKKKVPVLELVRRAVFV